MRDIGALCEREGIQLTFYVMPESSEFRGWFSDDAKATFDAYLKTLCANAAQACSTCASGSPTTRSSPTDITCWQRVRG